MQRQIIGEQIGRNLHRIMGIGSGTEILYSFVIIVCSLMIYFGTKELYELTSHKGIKYFRQAFLFFAFAYFFRSLIKTIIFYFNVQGIYQIPRILFHPIFAQATMLLFMYFSFMAVFYLTYSLMWKKWNQQGIYIFHIIAIIISFMTLSRSVVIYIVINIILSIFVLTVFILSRNQSKKIGKLHLIYLLLLFFWILNILDIMLPKFLKTYQLLIYLVSTGIFLTILYKVLRTVGK